MYLVLRLEDDPREIGIAAQGVDHDPLHLDVEGIKNIADQFVGQRTLIMLAPHRHGNGPPDAGLHMNDETLFLITNKNGQRVLIGGENAKDLHPHDIRVHN